MKGSGLLLAAMGVSLLIPAALAFESVQAKAQLVIALQGTDATDVDVGTNKGTLLFPHANVDTSPTWDVGNEAATVNQNKPSAKPYQAPAFSSPPPAIFATPPAYTPPASQGGTYNPTPR
jgi:hypothetical protein